MNPPVKQIYEFGPFTLDPDERQLLRGGEPVPLSVKAFETLLVLVKNSGRVVDKGELLKQVWPNTFIEETTLAQNIFTLRRALGETHHQRQYIETVPKRGYRFIADVKVSETAGAAHKSRQRGARAGSAGTAKKTITSLAVLPFANNTDDQHAEYLSDGIIESIINNLAQLPQLRVMSRSTVFRYKGQDIDARQVGRDLEVEAVLVGRVLKVGDRLSLRTELVDVANGWRLWGDHYNLQTSDIFEVEHEMSERISENLRLHLTDNQRAQFHRHHAANMEAYEAYLNGRYHWNERTVKGYRLALEYFREAVRLDLNYALGFAGLADAYTFQCIGFQGWLRPSDYMPKAKVAALKALELDGSLAEAHTSLAYVKWFWEWDWAGAESMFRRAIELNPGYAHAHHMYAHFLMASERWEESRAEAGRAAKLEPLDPSINEHPGWYYLCTHRHGQAIEHLRRALELHPTSYTAHLLAGMNYAKLKDYTRAIEYHRRAFELERTGIALGFLGYTLAAAGERDEALKILSELLEESQRSHILPYQIALIHIGLGDKEQAFEWLERAADERVEWICYLNISPELEGLRSDPRLTNLIQRVGIPSSKQA